MDVNESNFRAPVITDQNLSSGNPSILRNPFNISTNYPPPLPPVPIFNGANYGQSYGMSYDSYPSNYTSFGGGFNTYNSNPYSYGGIGGNMFGGGIYGNGYSNFNNRGFMNNQYDPESRFIQLAEENSRPAFESIGSLVSAVANIAAMLDSTFYAITSSFHAILGVAANFGRLRSVFSQFWQTFAIFRGLTWIYKKLCYWLKLSNIDPSSQIFKEAFETARREAENGNLGNAFNNNKASPWPVVIFLGFIFTAPYVVMKLLGNLTSSVVMQTKDPKKWINAIKSSAVYDFQGRNTSELSFKAGQHIYIAPRDIQTAHKLLNTGWALATIDGINSGLIPITYCKKVESQKPTNTNLDSLSKVDEKQGLENEILQS